jgi:hypothetical protein
MWPHACFAGCVFDEKFRFTSENVGRITDIVALPEPKSMKQRNGPQLGTSEWTLLYSSISSFLPGTLTRNHTTSHRPDSGPTANSSPRAICGFWPRRSLSSNLFRLVTKDMEKTFEVFQERQLHSTMMSRSEQDSFACWMLCGGTRQGSKKATCKNFVSGFLARTLGTRSETWYSTAPHAEDCPGLGRPARQSKREYSAVLVPWTGGP